MLEAKHPARTGWPKSLGHYLKSHISKTTIHDGKFKTYLERENSGNYFDIKFTFTDFCIGNLRVKENIPTKLYYICKVLKYMLTSMLRDRFSFKHPIVNYFLIKLIICMEYGTITKLTFNKNGLVYKKNHNFCFVKYVG